MLGSAGVVGAILLTPSVLPPIGGPSLSAKVVNAAGAGEGSFKWPTWGDHYLPEQLEEAALKYNIKTNPTLSADNSEALLEVQQVGGKQIDLMSDMLTFTEQESDTAKLLADESAWLATTNLGIEDRVREAGGPYIKTFVSREGSIGWTDGEMLVKDAANQDVAMNWLSKMESGE